MHTSKNDQGHIWILSGTGEGPSLVKALVRGGWKVSVSVVSNQAASSYLGLPLEEIWIGPLEGVHGIKRVLKQAEQRHHGFAYVIDATHPFALVISADLRDACNESNQHLIRFDRPLESPPSDFSLIKTLRELPEQGIKGQKVLFAIGARHLNEAVEIAQNAGAIPFARVLPSHESLRYALACELPPNHLAVLRPLLGQPLGEFEVALCRRWGIELVVCRQSGGLTQILWQDICNSHEIDLCLISRPLSCKGVETVNSLEALLFRLSAGAGK